MARPRPGTRFQPEQRPSWSDGNGPDDPPRGYYPVDANGNVDTSIRLRLVDDAPDDPTDGACHFEVMPREAGVGYFHATNRGDPVPEVGVVPLEAHAHGKAKSGGALERAATKIRYLFWPPR